MKGSCLCGAVAFELASPFISANICHCRQCQKSHGGGGAAYGSCMKQDVVWLTGKKRIRRYASSERVRRGFCKDCGCSIYYYNKDFPNHIDIALGVLDSDPNIAPEKHIYVAEKSCWYSLNDDLPKFEYDG